MSAAFYRVLFVLVALAALWFAADRVLEARYQRGRTDMQKSIETDQARLLTISQDAAREKERELRRMNDAAATKRYEDNKHYETTIANLNARIRSGAVGLSVAVATDHCGSPGDTGVAARPGKETRADLMPGTVERIFSIAGRSAVDVRDYNDLVDAYDAAREACNAK